MSLQDIYEKNRTSEQDTGINTISPPPINFTREYFRIGDKIYRVDHTQNHISSIDWDEVKMMAVGCTALLLSGTVSIMVIWFACRMVWRGIRG